VQVLFDGHPVPLLYVSPTQINAVAGVPLTFSIPLDGFHVQIWRDGVAVAAFN
jgi:uncharacterized protein (TIGR03437 family)